MIPELQKKVSDRFSAVVKELFDVDFDPPLLDTPPNLAMGDLSIASCFELAKQVRQPPRKIAEQLAACLIPLEGVERVSIAGAGYVNLHLDRARLAAEVFRVRSQPGLVLADSARKTLVEHTSINPNKAAHIGHLRNAVLGDTFVRLLRFRGRRVEVENYIDNTGVQVADVVVGFTRLEKKDRSGVARLIDDPAVRFDYYCWELYARVFQHYESNRESLAWRAQALKEIEEGRGETAAMAEMVSRAITSAHLETMLRVNVRYDLLVQESEILRLHFWSQAFELMKQKGAIRFEGSGKNAGCWVMRLDEAADGETTDEESGSEDVKIIVRSNGTVTYVGKDIAYHLWKFGLLGKDFGYHVFHQYADGRPVWSSSEESGPDSPKFGRADVAYAVIDTRQSYLQDIVEAALRALGYRQQAENLHHFAYEVVGLTPRCAEEMGVTLSDEDRQRAYIEVSGRKGLGIKADDLIDRLTEKALAEVRARKMTHLPAEQESYARMIAVAALRYFLLKFSRRIIIAFDFGEALAFEGETGPYLQYSVVRARNIFRKYGESHRGFDPAKLLEQVSLPQLRTMFASADAAAFWELTLLAAQLESVADQAVATEEPAALAKYAFRLAQTFNNFYHRFHILSEEDATRQAFLLFLVHLVSTTLTQTLDLLGIEVPERM